MRKWAYKAIREHRGSTYNNWLDAVLAQCQNVNTGFQEQLPYSEIKATAKSIAKYCWKKDAYCYQEFIDRQSRKGKLGGIKGGISRSLQYEPLRIEARKLRATGMSYSKIAERLGCTKATAIKWCKSV